MAKISSVDKEKLELALNMKSGYVLYFTDASLRDFIFSETGVNIDDAKYHKRWISKANRLRTFWELENENVVGKLISEMLEMWKFKKHSCGKDFDAHEERLYENAKAVAEKLISSDRSSAVVSKNDKLSSWINVDFVQNPEIRSVLQIRLTEIEKCMNSWAYLAVVILSGSLLEWMLHSVAETNLEAFNRAKSAPKAKDSPKVKFLSEWTLQDLINVAHEIWLLREDVKKYGHALRDFRNYIHPKEQIKSQFHPDETTAKMSLLTLESAINSLAKK